MALQAMDMCTYNYIDFSKTILSGLLFSGNVKKTHAGHNTFFLSLSVKKRFTNLQI